MYEWRVCLECYTIIMFSHLYALTTCQHKYHSNPITKTKPAHDYDTGNLTLSLFLANVVEDRTTREGILDSTLRTTFKACRWNQNPSLAVTVVKEGQQVFSRGYGVRDLESRKPITTHTMLGIGSLTKIFANLLIQKYMSNYSR